MLFMLTGDIQTGKTRWLMGVLERLRAGGVRIDGVLAPGVWVEHPESGEDAHHAYEKVGIDNILLPQGERIPFARRRDLAELEGSYDEDSQSARGGLHWAIYDTAIMQVNAHFRELAGCEPHEPGLLVADELGMLELVRGEGLTAAVELLDRGTATAHPHALVVVRAGLLETALERFDAASWGGIRVIAPDSDGEQALRDSFGI